jgi:hypothetical protein
MTIWIDPTGNAGSSDCNGLIVCISELAASVEQRWDMNRKTNPRTKERMPSGRDTQSPNTSDEAFPNLSGIGAGSNPHQPGISPPHAVRNDSTEANSIEHAFRQVFHPGLVEQFGLRYYQERLAELWKALAKDTRRGVKVNVTFDRSNVGCIEVTDPRSRERFPVHAMDHQYTSGLTLSQHNANRQSLRRVWYKEHLIEWASAKGRIHQLIMENLQVSRQPAQKPTAHDLEERFGTVASSSIRGSDKRATNWTGTNPRNSSRPRKTIKP